MPLEREIWEGTVQEKLVEDNSWLQAVSDVEDSSIVNGRIVHIPQAGAPSKVEKNRQTLPAQVKQRKDAEVLYVIDEYTTDPIHISNADTKELSYDKRRSILDQDVENLSEEVAEGMLTNFVVSPIGDNKELPKDHILFTTGDLVDASADNATGKRKAESLNDLQTMRVFFKRKKAWTENQMFCLLSAAAEARLFPANSMLTATYMAAVTEEERRSGVMYKVQGWKIFSRSSVYTLSPDKTFKAFGGIGEATDCEGSLFWNKTKVEKAFGTMETFDRERDPQYYGDIYSFLVRMGGRAKRADYAGVGVLMQAPAA
ncbi:hypothetical protein BAZ12_00710 [Elizabethkingia miricola]|uniref:hypothetical protein n=1 Tax=Elizabethkingia TaxID=308865 RepID=UPI00083FF5B1|nr:MULTISPECIES: hypothetical protein [Elizabethkingia]DAP61714.1 MAG TPA: Major capsid protein [Caudoviricetes sp.]MCL1652588.1 hypothetical protein [Elizabethkingia miricola]OCW73152.1 hypothetical protein A4G24_15870 [Elizabethkingia anophelis]OPC71135.1 hypothetical protein BAZ13_09810 [Elizabethkingia miricola]OPC75596.1 hypothetical protein BAZ12_00710 [Elizabethkingia miricola]